MRERSPPNMPRIRGKQETSLKRLVKVCRHAIVNLSRHEGGFKGAKDCKTCPSQTTPRLCKWPCQSKALAGSLLAPSTCCSNTQCLPGNTFSPLGHRSQALAFKRWLRTRHVPLGVDPSPTWAAFGTKCGTTSTHSIVVLGCRTSPSPAFMARRNIPHIHPNMAMGMNAIQQRCSRKMAAKATMTHGAPRPTS